MERAALFWFLCNLKRRKLSIPFLLFACCKGFGWGGGRDEITTTKVYTTAEAGVGYNRKRSIEESCIERLVERCFWRMLYCMDIECI
ncbi:hypothetical protein CI102_4190 [Trichoderma harzianum]|nr:hypothetical protein CI102_4190 [Trichoderma harzianum]